jgi:hypothetical protein
MTPRQIVNRGYNLMIVAFLFFIGLSMGASAAPEGDFTDKIDDLGLLAIGLIAVAWYLASGRAQRSVIPLALTLLALAFQTLGVFLEVGDKTSFGDNIGGLVMLAPFTLFAFWQYVRQPEESTAAVAPMSAERALS